MIETSSFMRTLRFFATAAFALACRDPLKPLSPSDVVGAWVLDLSAPPTCTSSGAGQQLHLDLMVVGQSQAPTGSVSGGWDFDTRVPPRYAVAGSVDFRTGRLIGALWQQPNSLGSSLDVTVGGYHSLRGQLLDPASGASPNFTGGSCTFDVVGHR